MHYQPTSRAARGCAISTIAGGVVIVLVLLVCLLAGCGSAPKPTDRAAVLDATRPERVAPVDPGAVSRGVDTVGVQAGRVNAHASAVSRASARLSAALKRGADYKETRQKILEYVSASNAEAAELLRKHFTAEDIRDAELQSMVDIQQEEIQQLSDAGTTLYEKMDELRIERDRLVADAAKVAENTKSVDKHHDASLGVVTAVEGELRALKKWQDDNLWKVHLVDGARRLVWWIVGLAVLYLLARYIIIPAVAGRR